MRTILMFLLAAVVLGTALEAPKAAPVPDQQMHALKRKHKAQQKVLKQQQRAMKHAAKHQAQSRAERKRFHQTLKMQRKLLKKGQKEETDNLKRRHKGMKRARAAP
jgi:hypothetical protein